MDDIRKRLEEFKASMEKPRADAVTRAKPATEFQKSFDEYRMAQQEARERLLSELPGRAVSGAIPGSVGALAGYGAQIPGGFGDLANLYQSFKPESFGDLPAGVQALPTTEDIQDLLREYINDSPEFSAGMTGGNAVALGQAATALPALVKGVAKGTPKVLGNLIDEILAPRSGPSGQRGAITYHGSPHRFPPTANNPLGEFDSSKIGTGEGAQAYGHGLYLAETPGVALGYQKRLSNIMTDGGYDSIPRTVTYGSANPRRVDLKASSASLTPAEMALTHAGITGSPFSAAQEIRQMIAANPPDIEKYRKALALLESGKLKASKIGTESGSLYKVDLPDEQIAKMLDWDKPLSQQSWYRPVADVVKEYKGAGKDVDAYAKLISKANARGGEVTGGQLYEGMLSQFGGDQAKVSEFMREAGIPGIRYLDQGSRGASGTGKWRITYKDGKSSLFDFKPNDDVLKQMGATAKSEGTSNFVVFDPKHMNIVGREKKGGAVSQDVMNLAVMNKRVQHKQVGGAMKGVKAVMNAAEEVKRLNAAAKAGKIPSGEAAQKLAQERAALPPAKGGLGLPKDNTSDQRAKAQNYVDYYHGTQRLDRLLSKPLLDPKRATSGPMPYGTTTKELASSYATKKADTSRIAKDEGDISNYFQVLPKDLGLSGRSPISVERSWNFLSPEQKETVRALAPRVGYENLDEFSGPLIVHPEGVNATLSPNQWDYLMKTEANGNPLTALRQMWHDSGQLYNNEDELAKIYNLAGYKFPISQENAPWIDAQGVLLGKARMENPINTSDNEYLKSIVPTLRDAFKRDRTQLKYGPDQWGKESRYTPKSWVNELEKDLSEGNESYVWTSIPDKVTEELKKLGHDSILDVSGKGGGSKEPVVIPFDPSQVRSRFAAFDPFRKSAAIAAAMGVAAPDLLAAEPENKASGGAVTSDDLLLEERML